MLRIAGIWAFGGVRMCVCIYACLSACGCICVHVCVSQQRFDQVELVSVLAGEDGGFLVVFHQFIYGAEPALADTVDLL